jgi:hypothetical protein
MPGHVQHFAPRHHYEWERIVNTTRIAGVGFMVIGVILFLSGVAAADSFGHRWSSFFTGNLGDATVWYMLCGIALTAAGSLMLGVTRRA